MMVHRIRRTDHRGGRRSALFAVIGLVLLGVVGHISPASAGTPTRLEFSIPQSGPHFLTEFCGTEILQDGVIHGTTTLFGDGSAIQHVHVDVVLTANGMTAYEQPRFTVVFDPEAGTATVSGTVVKVHAPGAGVLLQEVGHVVQDFDTGGFLFAAGRFMIRDGETDRLCSYFGAS